MKIQRKMEMENSDRTQNVNLNALTLSNAMMLEINESTGCHLNASKNSDNFQNPIVKTRRQEDVILLRAAPKIRSALQESIKKKITL